MGRLSVSLCQGQDFHFGVGYVNKFMVVLLATCLLFVRLKKKGYCLINTCQSANLRWQILNKHYANLQITLGEVKRKVKFTLNY